MYCMALPQCNDKQPSLLNKWKVCFVAFNLRPFIVFVGANIIVSWFILDDMISEIVQIQKKWVTSIIWCYGHLLFPIYLTINSLSRNGGERLLQSLALLKVECDHGLYIVVTCELMVWDIYQIRGNMNLHYIIICYRSSMGNLIDNVYWH